MVPLEFGCESPKDVSTCETLLHYLPLSERLSGLSF